MSSVLNTAMSGLLAFQRSLATVSHNVANVDTEGYSRQRVELSTRPEQQFAGGYVGAGVQAVGVRRVLDQFLLDAMRVNLSEQGRLATLGTLSEGIDMLLADSDAGLVSALRDFSDSVQAVADDPTSSAARRVMLSDMRALENRFGVLDQRLTLLDSQVTGRLEAAATEVTALAQSIADFNGRILEGGRDSNDLLDKRDLALEQLSEKISVIATAQNDGTVSVFAASGQALVLGKQANRLEVVQGEFGGTTPELELTGVLGGGVISGAVQSGELRGLLDFRREMLDPARNTLGQLAVALTGAFNAQHRQGMTALGALGGDAFAVAGPSVLASTFNGGAGSVTASVADVGSLTSGDYMMSYDGAAYSLVRLDTGAAVAMAGSGTAVDPFVADGLEIVVGGAIAPGDRFLIRPTRDGASSFSALISDANEIAAATPIRTTLDSGNVGDAKISAGEIVDVADPNLLTAVTIEFTGPASYSINGAGNFAYVSGEPIDVNGWRVQISGAPLTGERFLVESNVGGAGDNRNALALAGVLDQKVLNGGRDSVNSGYASLLADVAALTRSNQINLSAQTVVTEQARADQLSVSGVNLDEEAANLLRFQQAYQATAQLISVADTLFQTLLVAVRR